MYLTKDAHGPIADVAAYDLACPVHSWRFDDEFRFKPRTLRECEEMDKKFAEELDRV